MKGGLMVCGTTSDAGKSVVVAGLCRLLARQGVRVAPFKAQNMALNSYVTLDGAEIGRAQASQAAAAGIEPEAAMNPILLKPTGTRTSQVVVMGKAQGDSDAAGYQERKEQLWPVVTEALDSLRRRYDVVICEGAGSPAEINLAAHDIVNLRVAAHAGFTSVLVGDIERGGVFAGLFGTHALVPSEFQSLIGGFIINRFRGDPDLLGPGLTEITQRTGVNVLGVLPYLEGLAIDAEDSLALAHGWLARPTSAATAAADVSANVASYAGQFDPTGALDIAVVAFPRLSNFTDLEPLAAEPNVRVRLVEDPRQFGHPDLVILPGSKSTVEDLAWMRAARMEVELHRALDEGATILGLCGGYQMLGLSINDKVESGQGDVPGLGLLDVHTVFDTEKLTRRRSGRAMGETVDGYEIHHGRSICGPSAQVWLFLDGEPEGAWAGRVYATSLHGLFESDGFRETFLSRVAQRRGISFVPGGLSFGGQRQQQFDRVADALAHHLDMGALAQLIAQGAP
ncbi:MAG: cobyric acid synthase [Acidimicrobiales bacterium]